MREVKGNLWSMVPCDVRVITTNGSVNAAGLAVMGRGCALEASRRYPGLKQTFGVILRAPNSNHVQWPHPEIVTFPVKHRWFEVADLALIGRSAQELLALTNEHGWQHVMMPRPGCGNGRLSWAQVKPILEPILDDRFVVCSFAREV